MVKRALLIGINEYSDPDVLDLHGCENDVEAMAEVLAGSYRFEPVNLTKLTGAENTTRQRILDELTRLIEVTEEGDVAVVYYSGHGSQVPDRDGDEEEDHKDETIVPSDSGRGGRPVLDIVDDELKSYVGALSQRTPYATVIFDSCHSKSVTKEIEASFVMATRQASQRAPRATPAASEPLAVPTRLYPGFKEPSNAAKSETGLFRKGEYLLIAGCQDDETSKEVEFNGVPRGSLTYYLVEQLRSGANSTVEAIFDQVRPKVERTAEDGNETQRPVLEGPEELTGAHPFSPVFAAVSRPTDEPDKPDEPDEPDQPDPKDEPGEWDGKFAGLGAVGIVVLLAVVGGLLAVLTCSSLDGQSSETKVVMTFVIELVFVGLLLGMAGAYIALLNLRGRLRAVRDVVAATSSPAAAKKDVEGRAVPSIGADEVKGLIEAIGKMPTARALIVVGGLIIGGAVAFAWDVLPGQLDGKAPSIVQQPAALAATIGDKAQFDVATSGSDLEFEWKRNGKTIPWAGNSSTLFIEPVTKADRNDVFTVVVKNENGVTPSDGAKLTVKRKGGKK